MNSNTRPYGAINLAQIKPLTAGYAHNDYEYNIPLWDALSQGYTFIEVDVHLVDNALIASHYFPALKDRENTLTNLYLAPLFALYQEHQSHILPQYSQPICLMIDIKTDAEDTYQQLLEKLRPFQEMLTKWTNNVKEEGVVSILISGNRPIQTIANETHRWVSIDGRLKDLGKGYHPELMPMISDRFTKVCWQQLIGRKYSKREVRLLHQLVEAAHGEGKMIRFWRTPEEEKTWELLWKAGVDWINTDKIYPLADFLTALPKRKTPFLTDLTD